MLYDNHCALQGISSVCLQLIISVLQGRKQAMAYPGSIPGFLFALADVRPRGIMQLVFLTEAKTNEAPLSIQSTGAVQVPLE